MSVLVDRDTRLVVTGLTVHELWIEAASEIASEYYASVVFDRSAKAPLLMLSTKGGMDIEEVADEDPMRLRGCTSTRCWASRTSTPGGWPSPPAWTPTSSARWASC